MKPAHVYAATSNTVNFQARLETSAGAITPDGYYNVEFKLYSASSGGTAEWTEDYTYSNGSGNCSGPNGIGDCRARVVNGYLTTNLGSITAFPGTINWNQQQWLTMNIGGTAGSGTITWDGEMNPRLLLTAVPYAFQAGQLGATNGVNVATLSFTTPTATDSILLPDASGTVCLQHATGCGFAPSTGVGAAFVQGGNSFGTQGVLGTNDNNSLAFGTNSTNRLVVDTSATTNFTFQQASNILVAGAATGMNLTIQGGTATSGTNVGGNLILQGGAGASTGASGSVIVKSNTNNSTTAFQVQNAAGANLFTADTTNGNIVLGNDGTPAALTIRGGAATGTNVAGANITVDASNGTGNAGSGDLILRTAAGSGGPGGSPTFDSSAFVHQAPTPSNPVTWSQTTANQPNRLLIVTIAWGATGISASGVTYAGQPLSRVTSNVTCLSSACVDEMWYMVNPPVGTGTISVTWTGSAQPVVAGSSTYYNVNTSSPFGTVATNTGHTAGFSNSITTSTNQLVVDGIAGTGNNDLQAAGGQTGLYADDTSNNGGSSYKISSGTSTTMAWTDAATDQWAQIAAPINPAPAGGSAADTLTDRLHITASGNVGINTATPMNTLDVAGTARIAANSTTAFQIQNSIGTNILSVDTTNLYVTIGAGATGEATPTLLVLDSQTVATSDPTGVTGAMYYNASLGEFRCYTEAEWEPCRTQPIDQSYEVDEEWLSGSTATANGTTSIGNYNWTLDTITTACASLGYAGGSGGVAVSASRPGILKLTTASSAANIGCRLLLGPTTGGTMGIGLGEDVKAAVAVGSISANVMRVGLDTNTTGGTGTGNRSHTGVWWEADPSNNSHWEYCYGNGSAAVCTASATSIAANTFVRLEIQIISPSSVYFTINGQFTALNGITLDTAASVAPNLACWTETSGTAATCYSDYYQLRSDDSARR